MSGFVASAERRDCGLYEHPPPYNIHVVVGADLGQDQQKRGLKLFPPPPRALKRENVGRHRLYTLADKVTEGPLF